jgi:predicted XRE-type DNA-binding protein
MTRSTRPFSWIKAALREFEIDLVKDRLKKLKEMLDEEQKASGSEGKRKCFSRPGTQACRCRSVQAILAAEIIKALNREGLSVRGAQGRTGIAAADFSRIRNADLERFTLDRLMSIINRLGSHVEVKIKVRRAETVERVL